MIKKFEHFNESKNNNKDKKSHNPNINDLINKYKHLDNDDDDDSAAKIYKAFKKGSKGHTHQHHKEKDDSESYEQWWDNVLHDKKKQKEKRTEEIPEMKDHIIIKDDVSPFYFVDDSLTTTCGADGYFSEVFNDFNTDDDGNITGDCTNCKFKGKLKDHINEITYIDLNK